MGSSDNDPLFIYRLFSRHDHISGCPLPPTMRSYLIDNKLQNWASQVALVVKNPPANAGDVRDAVRSLGWEDPLEKGMATHSSVLAWRIPWTTE